MRFALLTLLVAGCFSSASELSGTPGDDDADPAPGQTSGFCNVAEDCVLAGATCCDCPSFALTVDDPKVQACENVGCDNDTSVCATNVEAACVANQCQMVCAPLACLPCPNGYALEVNGCLSCSCAPAPSLEPACAGDPDCTRTRADCCGCEAGGEDTAVPVTDAAVFDQALMCPASPQCPGQTNALEPTCGTDYEARCVNGSCTLAPPAPPDLCGPEPCPAGKTCQINVNPDANPYGLGVCL